MKSFIKLAAISIAIIFAIYFFSTQTLAPTSPKSAEVKTPPTTSTAASENLLLAEIDQQKITGADYNRYLKLFKDSGHDQPVNPAIRELQIKNLINRILLLQEARKQGYFEDKELEKHGSLNQSERETLVLRKFLTDKVSRPATIAEDELDTYLKAHPNYSAEAAREQLTTGRQQQIFLKLMQDLKDGHHIVIHHENLKQL